MESVSGQQGFASDSSCIAYFLALSGFQSDCHDPYSFPAPQRSISGKRFVRSAHYCRASLADAERSLATQVPSVRSLNPSLEFVKSHRAKRQAVLGRQ